MNSPKYHSSKVDKNLVEFIERAYRIMVIMRVPLEEKAELVAYQLKGMEKFGITNGSRKEVW